jgi:hypothetical protein
VASPADRQVYQMGSFCQIAIHGRKIYAVNLYAGSA